MHFITWARFTHALEIRDVLYTWCLRVREKAFVIALFSDVWQLWENLLVNLYCVLILQTLMYHYSVSCTLKCMEAFLLMDYGDDIYCFFFNFFETGHVLEPTVYGIL